MILFFLHLHLGLMLFLPELRILSVKLLYGLWDPLLLVVLFVSLRGLFMIDWLISLFPSGWIGSDQQSIIISCVCVTACVVVIYAIDSVASIFRDLFRRKGG